jgi:hypothetical protein
VVRRCGGSGDEGIDLVIETRGASDVVQCKRWKADVGAAVVREFYGSLMHAGARHGFIITTAKFTEAARQFARGKPITLIDGHRLLQWLGGHYTAETASETQKPAGESVDPYEVLGVPRNATRDQIRTSYKRMMAMYHPDKVSHLGPELQEVAQVKARELNRAYELLMNHVSGDRAG